ncbi:hypothetical protein E0I74_01135 [Rhizobium laguerreae]|uniref:hypothetical protein n=1 Tax=Rhizobium laguerreae TaxID=1076926 RepID=UPI00103A4A46|nr:hypothetical protein [Rhizobium laguerreae]TBX82767.1 hypothetical protein E0I74_01135 [Rhizobium laguerreae]
MSDREEFDDIVYQSINSCARTMARYPKENSTLGEDQLSVMLLAKLEGLGLNAFHDATSGGHCDIFIKEGEEMLWLGEAKMVTGQQNAHIEDGYLQLLSRYATALPNQDKGGLIVFCKCPRIDAVLEGWIEYIHKKRPDLKAGKHDTDVIEYFSSEKHVKNGRMYQVWHKPISIYWNPEEREVTSRKSD